MKNHILKKNIFIDHFQSKSLNTLFNHYLQKTRMKESNNSRNVEDVKINIELKEQERVLHTKVIEKWKKKIKEQKGNKQAKLIEENALQDKTGKQVGFNFL